MSELSAVTRAAAHDRAWGMAAAMAAGLALLVGASAWIGYGVSGPHIAKDYEDCAEEAQANAASSAEYSKLVTHCGEGFAGRRKAGGGYTYFDFMQNRSFDIAGPNPTEDERKRIDRYYMEFLGSQGTRNAFVGFGEGASQPGGNNYTARSAGHRSAIGFNAENPASG